MKVFDIILNAFFDLLIEDGDFVIGESTAQHQQHLLVGNQGDFRQFPLVGVGISQYLNDDELADLGKTIQTQFEVDGMQVKKLNITEDGKIDLKASY